MNGADQVVVGIEVMQLRALADALARVDQDARVDLTLTDAILHAQVEDGDRRRSWFTVDINGAVMHGIGTAPDPVQDRDGW